MPEHRIAAIAAVLADLPEAKTDADKLEEIAQIIAEPQGCGYCMTCGYGGQPNPRCPHKPERRRHAPGPIARLIAAGDQLSKAAVQRWDVGPLKDACAEWDDACDTIQHPSNAPARLVDGVTICECGSAEFRFEERVDSWREQERNADGMLSFRWDPYNIDAGDDTPGVICLGCRHPVTLPDGVLAWDGAQA